MSDDNWWFLEEDAEVGGPTITDLMEVADPSHGEIVVVKHAKVIDTRYAVYLPMIGDETDVEVGSFATEAEAKAAYDARVIACEAAVQDEAAKEKASREREAREGVSDG